MNPGTGFGTYPVSTVESIDFSVLLGLAERPIAAKREELLLPQVGGFSRGFYQQFFTSLSCIYFH